MWGDYEDVVVSFWEIGRLAVLAVRGVWLLAMRRWWRRGPVVHGSPTGVYKDSELKASTEEDLVQRRFLVAAQLFRLPPDFPVLRLFRNRQELTRNG